MSVVGQQLADIFVCVCAFYFGFCGLKLNNMAVSFPTKLGITSIASDVPIKKHTLQKRT